MNLLLQIEIITSSLLLDIQDVGPERDGWTTPGGEDLHHAETSLQNTRIIECKVGITCSFLQN